MSKQPSDGLPLSTLATRLGGRIAGEADPLIFQVAPLEHATARDLSFLTNSKYRAQLASTRAAAVIVAPRDEEATTLPRIVIDNPYAAMARVLAWLNPPERPPAGVHPSAALGQNVRLGREVAIGPHAVIGDDVEIGDGAIIEAGCFVGNRSRIGAGSRLYSNVTVYHGVTLGQNCILHSGAVLGADGFGFAPEGGRWLKIPQVGGVVLGDDVEIGASTTVDRGALADTVIEDGVKIDNQVHIAHNCHIGAHTVIAGCTGIAGSTRIGRHCIIAGAAMIIGHLEICDNVHISVGTLITKSIRTAGQYTSAMPFSTHQDWLKNASQLRRLAQMQDQLKELQQKVHDLERKTP